MLTSETFKKKCYVVNFFSLIGCVKKKQTFLDKSQFDVSDFKFNNKLYRTDDF